MRSETKLLSAAKLAAGLALAIILQRPPPSFAEESGPSASGNQRPNVTWLAPLDGSAFPAYANITLRASASDPDGSITRVVFLQGTNNKVLSLVTTAPYTAVWQSVPPGTYTLRALATDNANAGTLTTPVTITVSQTGNSGGGTPPPVQTPPSPPAPPPLTKYSLTVNNGSGSGSYAAGVTVSLAASAAPAGQVFDQWTGAAVADPASTVTTLVMPSANAIVSATFKGVGPAAPTNPILFVTQIPIGLDYTTIGSVFANHRPTPDSAGRGGDLYIRYPDGTLKNLTAAAGYGAASGFQGAQGIAVREPSVHWNGQKALFSMVVGSPLTQFTPSTNVWQIYEITGLGPSETPVIKKIPNQPANYNNVSPCYGTNGRIIFASDRPRNGQNHLYPQLDEYELAPSTTGLWSLDPASGDLFNLNHTPSGAFSPSIDSFGRLVFVRWDHLQRDQEVDLDMAALAQGQPAPYGTFNYSDESSSAAVLMGDRTEVFPEPRTPSGNVNGHVFNFFFPWMIQEDGTEEETINHLGRHEIAGYLSPSFNDDKNLGYFYNTATRYNKTYVNNLLHLKEDPQSPGRYFGTDAPEFSTHASGQIVALNAPQGLDADYVTVDYITDPITKMSISTPSTNHSGHFRDPLPLSNGTIVAVHDGGSDYETKRSIGSDYAFRLKTLWRPGTYWVAYQPLTPGISKSVSYYTGGGGLVSYNGPLWELNPVEVRSRPVPQASKTSLGQPEQQIFNEEGINVAAFQEYLKTNDLALVIGRNLTTRDHADRQQPFNLHVAGTSTETLGAGGFVYDVSYLQFFQADQIRGLGMRTPTSQPQAGRRVLAQPLHDSTAIANNPANLSGPAGSVQLGPDGSMVAMVPARRAMTWQLTDPDGVPVVRERYWVTFQPGEIRTCASCHGVNTHDQANRPAPTNAPAALRSLLQFWKSGQPAP